MIFQITDKFDDEKGWTKKWHKDLNCYLSSSNAVEPHCVDAIKLCLCLTHIKEYKSLLEKLLMNTASSSSVDINYEVVFREVQSSQENSYMSK